MYSKHFPTHLVPSHCLYLFGGDKSVLLDLIDPLDSTRLPIKIDYNVGYHLHLVQRCFDAYIVFHAASSSPSHTAQLLLNSSIRRVQHSIIESVVYCTTY